MSVKDLLRDTLNNHGVELQSKTHASDNISDVTHGRMYQNLVKEGHLKSDDLTLSWNCDGIPIFNSSNYSLWPLQFTINELPFAQRKENVMVSAIWFGSQKPRIDTFLKPFVDECRDLVKNPLQWIDSTGICRISRVFTLVCSSDAIARTILRNCKQFNGKFGCDWCLHPGEVVEKGRGFVRSYFYREHAERTHIQFKNDATEAYHTKSTIHGVKGLSILLLLPKFDIVSGFIPDYMHCVLLGVCRQMMGLWMDTCNHLQPWYIGRKIQVFDRKLLTAKPPTEITRSPRSIATRKFWKASEWRAFLLYYAFYVLPGILPAPYLEHFLLLSCSIHLLLQQSVSFSDIRKSEASLIAFVKKMELLYGKENVSFNVHQLTHLATSVRNWGPLWSTSAFIFESNNGFLKTLYNGTQCVPQQIVETLFLWREIPKRLNELCFQPWSDFGKFVFSITGRSPLQRVASLKTVSKPSQIYLTASMEIAIENLIQAPVLNKNAESYDRFIFGNVMYHTAQYKRVLKRDNTFAKLKDTYAQLLYFLISKINCVCQSKCSCSPTPILIVQVYSVLNSPLMISSTITAKTAKTRQTKAYFLNDLVGKCVHTDGWMISLPNKFETD